MERLVVNPSQNFPDVEPPTDLCEIDCQVNILNQDKLRIRAVPSKYTIIFRVLICDIGKAFIRVDNPAKAPLYNCNCEAAIVVDTSLTER